MLYKTYSKLRQLYSHTQTNSGITKEMKTKKEVELKVRIQFVSLQNYTLQPDQTNPILGHAYQGSIRSRSTNDTTILANLRKPLNKRTGTEQLLFTAINQNHQSKSKLTRSISSQGVNALQQQQQHIHWSPHLPPQNKKNIPMVNNELPTTNQSRPQFRRWNLYNVPEITLKDPVLRNDNKPEGITEKIVYHL